MVSVAGEGFHSAIAAVMVIIGIVVILWMDHDSGWNDRLRRRLTMGFPWGSLVSLTFVLTVYLFLQGGWTDWTQPVTLPFAAWSYFSPFGVMIAAFSHSGPSHLVGNLLSGAVLLPIAEYAFGHFPTTRGESSFGSPLKNPWFRALIVFPTGVIFVGFLTAVWAWGPVIGFSGVVFAALGFAVVHRPILAIVAIVARGAIGTAIRSIMNPVIIREASRSFDKPWWAGIAVQGHALGLLIGAIAGVAVLWHRDHLGPKHHHPLRVWLSALLAATALNLWALWWIRGPDTYVLYRGLGIAFVILVSLLVTWAVVATDRELFGAFSSRQIAVGLLVVPLVVMALVAVPVNLNTVTADSTPSTPSSVEVRDYTVLYAENVDNGMVNIVDVSLFGETTSVTTSGVIVISEQRNVWSREVSPGRLALRGRATVVVGGLGWREEITVHRRGWSTLGGETAFKVWLQRDGKPRQLAFVSEPATAEPVLAGYNVSVIPTSDGFQLALSRNGSEQTRVEIPEEGEAVTISNITFSREGRAVLAQYNETSITIAKQETYR